MSARKIVGYLFIFLITFFTNVPAIEAASPGDDIWFNPPGSVRGEAKREGARSGSANSDTYGAYVMGGMITEIGCMIYSPADVEKAIELGCYSGETTADAQNAYQKTALGMVGSIVGATYTPPASTAYAFLDFSQQIGMPRSYAQGLGFGSLVPILPIWKAFRNLAYTVLMVFFLVIGFMIMFRVQMDAHTVIGIQQALPKIIVTLILITFSYAIAGLLIDLMYLCILLLISVVWGAFPNASFGELGEIQTAYLSGGWPTLLTNLFGPTLWDWGTVIKGAASIGGLLLGANWFGALGGVIGGLVVGAGGAALLPSDRVVTDEIVQTFISSTGIAGAISPIIYVIIMLGLLFMFIRILFLLINAYIQIVVAIVFAPLQILMDAFPGGGGGGHGGHGGGGSQFQSWIMNLIGNLAVFPTVIALIMVGTAINATIGGNNSPYMLWSPPLIPAWTYKSVQFVIGFGIISLIPSIAGAVKEALGAKAALPIGVGAPLAPFAQGAQTGMGMLQSFYYAQHSLHSMGGLIPQGGGHGHQDH